MRGQIPFPMVPPSGVRFDLPDHLVTPQSLPGYLTDVTINGNVVGGVGSYNVFLDEDGLLRPRQGYSTVDNQLQNPSERIMGLDGAYGAQASLADPSLLGYSEIAAGTTTLYYRFTDASGSTNGWNQCVGPNLNGGPDQPMRLITFYSGGQVYYLGVNQGLPLPILGRLTWSGALGGLMVFKPALPSPFTFSIQSTPFFNAVDIESLVNRVVVINCMKLNPSGSDAYRVQWSAVNDHTTWPISAFASLNDGGSELDQLIAIRRTSQTTAIIYRERSIWAMYAVAGNDPNAFGFERIPGSDGIVGPCSPAAVVSAGAYQYYFGLNNRIYMFDGSNAIDISGPIRPLIDKTINGRFINRTFGLYIQSKSLLSFVYPALSSSDPNVIVTYNLRTQAWESLWALKHPMSAGALVPDTSAPNTAVQVYHVFLAPVETSSIAGNIQRFFVGDHGDGINNPISCQYSSPLYRVDALNAGLIDSFEVFFKKANNSESVVVTLLGLQSPYDPNPVVVASYTLDISTPSNFFQKLAMGPNLSNNKRCNFVKVVITNNTALGQMAFAGGTVFVNPDLRGDSSSTK
jgi:hypothetical protein